MRIAVCDDEELFRIEFKSVLDKVLINAEYDIDTFSGGSSLYEAFLINPFDLVFLDSSRKDYGRYPKMSR